MQELKVVGLDAEGKNIICQREAGSPDEQFSLPIDDRLLAAARGDEALLHQAQLDIEVTNMLSPKEIQSRIRSGASVEQVAKASGSSRAALARVQRFANPVLLERSRAAELAMAAHPVLADGPAVLTLLETVTSAMVTRGLETDRLSWDAWRNEDGRWTVQLGWKAGRSDNIAHFRFAPGAHGGIVTAVDDAAIELVDPNFKPALRPLAPVAHLAFDEPAEAPMAATTPRTPAAAAAPAAATTPPPAEQPSGTTRRGKPAIPAWEDVLLGVRSGGQR
jgi:Protein of unknown function (DUF3071)